MIVIFRLFCVILLHSYLNPSCRAWRLRKRYFEFFWFHLSSTFCSYTRNDRFGTWYDRLSLLRKFSSFSGFSMFFLTLLIVAWHWIFLASFGYSSWCGLRYLVSQIMRVPYLFLSSSMFLRDPMGLNISALFEYFIMQWRCHCCLSIYITRYSNY